MNVDVLRYFKPGEKRKELHFPEAAQRLTNSNARLAELIEPLFETEVSKNQPFKVY